MCFTDKRKRNCIRKEDRVPDRFRPLGRVGNSGAGRHRGGKSCGMEVSGGGVECSGSMEVSLVEQLAARPPGRRPPCLPTLLSRPRPCPPPLPLPLPQPQISCILTAVDQERGLMDGPCDVDASSSCTAMRWSSPIKRKIGLAM